MPATIKSNSDLDPERSLTTEIGVGYQNENFSIHTNVFWTQNLGIISIDDESKLQNLYDAEVLGVDLGVVGILPLGATRKLSSGPMLRTSPGESKITTEMSSLCST